MRRALLVTAPMLLCAGLFGCAGARPAQQNFAETPPPSAITQYYEEATRQHVRSVRKPLRDQQRRAMHELAREAMSVFHSSGHASTDAQLAADASPSAAQSALTEYRESLLDIARWANAEDLAGVRRAYSRLVDARAQLAHAGIPLE